MILNTAAATMLNGAVTVHPRWFYWFKVKNRSTGATEQSGLWNGIGPITQTVDGVSRTYQGIGAMLTVPNFTYEKGLDNHYITLELSALTPQTAQLVREYDPKFGQVEIHLGLLDPATTNVGALVRAYKGFIDGAKISETETEATIELSVVSSVRQGTKTSPLKQSDAAQRLRNPNDAGRIYVETSGAIQRAWGSFTDGVEKFKAVKDRT